jgi:thioredoxin-dependent peroxiredoxin
MIKEGDRAPDVAGTTTDGTRIRLADYRGKQPVVLFFYPKDNTTVCTKEACSFRDHAGEIAAAGGVVLGVSMDSETSHKKFAGQHGLNFPLLSDRDASICKAFGVARLGGWLPPRRVTFVIDRDGIVRRVIASEFNANKHVDDAIATLRSLERPGAAAGR